MLVNLTKDEIKKIVFWLKFTEDKDLSEKLEPLIEVCTCKEVEDEAKRPEGDPAGASSRRRKTLDGIME